MNEKEFKNLIRTIETEKFRFGQLRSLWFSIEKRIQAGRRKTENEFLNKRNLD